MSDPIKVSDIWCLCHCCGRQVRVDREELRKQPALGYRARVLRQQNDGKGDTKIHACVRVMATNRAGEPVDICPVCANEMVLFLADKLDFKDADFVVEVAPACEQKEGMR